MSRTEKMYLRRYATIEESDYDILVEEGRDRGTDSQSVLDEIIKNGIKALKAKRRRRKKSS